MFNEAFYILLNLYSTHYLLLKNAYCQYLSAA